MTLFVFLSRTFSQSNFFQCYSVFFSISVSRSLPRSFSPTLFHNSCAPLCLYRPLFFSSVPLFLLSFFFGLSVSLFLLLPGVAHVKLTGPDKDNSLTHSVVYFSPLLSPLFHFIPLSSLTPLSSILPFNRVLWSLFFRPFLSICFIPPLFSPLVGNLFNPVISLSCCLLFDSSFPSSISPSTHLSYRLSIHLSSYLPSHQSVYLSIRPSISPSACPLPSLSSTFSTQSPPLPICANA